MKRIVGFNSDPEALEVGQAATLVLEDDLDVSRGDLLAAAAAPPEVSDQFEATIIWMDERPLLPERRYAVKIGARTVNARVTRIKHVLNVDNGNLLAAQTVRMNEIAVCHLATDAPIPFAPYLQDRTLGGFIVIDRETDMTAGAGLIGFALRRAGNVRLQELAVSKATRAARLGQRPAVLWFTGLSASGKSTIANLVEEGLQERGVATILLDGDNLRHGLNRDLGFTDADRVENVRRAAEAAHLMTEAGLVVLVALISPFRTDREAARARFEPSEFVEIFVHATLDQAESRDPKGLYAKARSGELPGFTGVDSPYEPPEAPEVRLDTGAQSAAAAAGVVLRFLTEQGLVH